MITVMTAGLSRLAGLAACAALLGLAVSGATVQAQAVGDVQVKAAFLFNFTKFVQWPDPSAGPIVICVASDDPFEAIVRQTVSGKRADGRDLQTLRLATGDDPSRCHIIYIADMPAHDTAEWIQRVRGSVLTVGSTAQFLRNGGMIRFFLDGNKMRFQISQRNAEAAGLKLHARSC